MSVYKTKFTLDKAYYQECYEESVASIPFHQAYFKAGILLLLGGCFVLFSEINQYAAWFVFSLGVLEAVAQYYRKPWWVMRQMLSRASKGEVELVIDETSISTTSFYSEQIIKWPDIQTLNETDKGWLIIHPQGRSYLSKQHLNTDIQQQLINKSRQILNE